jgi:hypothetical protein
MIQYMFDRPDRASQDLTVTVTAARIQGPKVSAKQLAMSRTFGAEFLSSSSQVA